MTLLQKRVFWVAVGIAAAAEGAVIYRQWPSPPVKVCASLELGNLLAAAAKGEAELHDARTRLRTDPDNSTPKDVMRLEAASAAAYNEVANFKQRAQEQQKASGASCS